MSGKGKLPVSRRVGYDGDEWYTPDLYIAAARQVMGGIDLDPASSEAAQEIVQAAVCYTKSSGPEGGLSYVWSGRVWLNPPYSNPDPFIRRLLAYYQGGSVTQAVVLVNNATETQWFQMLLTRCPACFLRRRIAFWQVGVTGKTARQGQTVFYLGDRQKQFVEVFSKHGPVVRTLEGKSG